MHKLTIYKNKITLTTWDETSNSWIENDIPETSSIVHYLNQVVEIKQDVTVEDFMLHLEKYEKDIDLCFYSYSDGIPLKLYLDEMKKESDRKTDIEQVEMYWAGEVMEEELVILGSMRGWVSAESAKLKGLNPDLNYGMECTPLNIWKKCLFSLNELIVVNNTREENNFAEEVVFDGFYKWTLHELISNFLCEITENGSPEDRERYVLALEEAGQLMIESPKTQENAAFWLDFLEADLEDTKVALEKAISEEKYEDAATFKSRIDVLTAEISDLNSKIDNIAEHE